MNDRQLRFIVNGLGGKANGTPREDGFDITVASETMAIFCLATSLKDLKERLSKIIVAYTYDNKPVTCGDLKAQGAMTALLKEALNPNLVQTLGGVPALVHGGPFANIAHGCNSVLATKTALKLADYTVTEAGFGADLGAEKFLDIKCRLADLKPDAVVMVATIRALKMHGGVLFDDLKQENVEALLEGTCNLKHHLDTMAKFGVPTVVCINHFDSDTEAETKALIKWCEDNGYKYAFCSSFTNGSKGGTDLAKLVIETLETTTSNYHPIYDTNLSIKEKILTIAKEVYGAADVVYSENAEAQIKHFEKLGYANTPICMAKTPQSITDNQKIIGAPKGFTISIREVRLSAGAGFIVPLTGTILTMPGLPAVPAAVKMEEN
jgi:formate--tetrahydrofolate ligase